MSEKKIQVPERMLQALQSVLRTRWGYDVRMQADKQSLHSGLEAAIGWLLEELEKRRLPSIANPRYQGQAWADGFNDGIDDVRRMFLAPDPEVPEEIGDLMWQPTSSKMVPPFPLDPRTDKPQYLELSKCHNDSVIEAYHRGKEAK